MNENRQHFGAVIHRPPSAGEQRGGLWPWLNICQSA